MIAVIALITGYSLLFVASVTGWSLWLAQRSVVAAEVAALKKVGGWYEKRVEELEFEAKQLANQIVAGGIAPRAVAMPREPIDDQAMYAFDDTGLVVEKLDPRDFASSL